MPNRITARPAGRRLPRAALLAALFLAELVGLALLFQIATPVECRLTALPGACRGLRGIVLAAICLAPMAAVALWSAQGARRELSRMVQDAAPGWLWPALHGSGICVIALPLVSPPASGLNAGFASVFAVLVIGALLAGVGALFWLAPPGAWRGWLRGRMGAVAALVIAAALLPMLAEAIAPLWYWHWLTKATFVAVALMLLAVGEMPVGDPAAQLLGAGDFVVAIADSCSGIEGAALITGFMALYAALFHRTLRMGRFWLVLWPAALLLSWLLNALRIAVLIGIGAHVSPELAVNGFHSFAGWLFFTLLALGVLVAASRMRWLQRGAAPVASAPLAEDAVAARILPFIVFMVSGVAAQAFWQVPALAWPWQAAAMAAALWWMRRPLLTLVKTPAPLAILAGAGVGVFWVLTAAGGGGAAGIALTGGAFAGWLAARLIGTAVLVPVVEELFFRGYVQARLDDGTPLRRCAAIALSAALFAALHGRWVAAGAAGVVFSLLYLRRGHLADAITAHMAANAVVAAVAVWTGDWELI